MARRIISLEKTQCLPASDINDMRDEEFRDNIIVYTTKPHGGTKKGLGILVQCTDHKFGFVYHNKLIKGKRICTTFKGDTPREAILAAIKTGRKVIIFASFEEFVCYAAENASRY